MVEARSSGRLYEIIPDFSHLDKLWNAIYPEQFSAGGTSLASNLNTFGLQRQVAYCAGGLDLALDCMYTINVARTRCDIGKVITKRR
jgi:hypothetical protein